ncbi:stonustoxin subunit alpha-like [Carettochelys insculpta]|uniref:stonustoxin subunit alpha-like n=1 Tax=Carettochelys insculpta TaxID=44489 RepID=UPI003EBF5E09
MAGEPKERWDGKPTMKLWEKPTPTDQKVISCVGDILVQGDNEEAGGRVTESVLQITPDSGFQVSRAKAQVVQQEPPSQVAQAELIQLLQHQQTNRFLSSPGPDPSAHLQAYCARCCSSSCCARSASPLTAVLLFSVLLQFPQPELNFQSFNSTGEVLSFRQGRLLLGITFGAHGTKPDQTDAEESICTLAMSGDTIEIPALGRPFQLGMLYDCRKDSLIPGITLWDLETLRNHVDTKPQSKTKFQIIASDTIEDKTSALSVTAGLKASFLSGLVEVSGSAEYLSDNKTSKHQYRVSLQYSTTTEFKQLTMSHLGRHNISYPDVFDQGTATHVVTAVLYGAQAFFVFDQEVSSSQNTQEIQGKLQVVIKKIPQVSIEGEGALKMDENEKALANHLSCRFYGDFALENNPTTYQDAMKIYCSLPALLGDNGEKAVPVRVWLYPLAKLDSRAARLVHEISTKWLIGVQTTLEQLTELDVRCNDMVKNQIATIFPEIQRKIQQFQELCKQHKQTFQQQLAELLPSIRGGGRKEGALVDILSHENQSPSDTQRLSEFLDTKEREMNYVNSYLGALSNVKVVSSESELDQIILDPQLDFVVSFTFTSLHEEEPYLAELKQRLQTQSGKETHDPASASRVRQKPNSKVWFEEREICKKARISAKALSKFVRVNKANEKTRFVVASVPDKAHPGASIYLYEDGDLISTNFQPPATPLPPLCEGIRHDHVQLTLRPATYGRGEISGYRAEYRIVGQENWMAVDVNNTQETLAVTGLCPNTKYQF